MCFCERRASGSEQENAENEWVSSVRSHPPPHGRKGHTHTWSHCARRPSPLRRCVTSDFPGAVSALSRWTSGRCSTMKGLLPPNQGRSLRKNNHSSSALNRMARTHYRINPFANDLAHMGHPYSLPIHGHHKLAAATSHFNLSLRTRIPQRVQALIPSLAKVRAHIVT